MDFDLTDEQRLIQETVRNFVDERVLPNAIRNDIEHRLDVGVIEGMAELGLLGIVIPRSTAAPGSTSSPRRCRARRSSAARPRSARSSRSMSG
jgi:alkylation response protein AidB-like acyl-CoA dehydrogenase